MSTARPWFRKDLEPSKPGVGSLRIYDGTINPIHAAWNYTKMEPGPGSHRTARPIPHSPAGISVGCRSMATAALCICWFSRCRIRTQKWTPRGAVPEISQSCLDLLGCRVGQLACTAQQSSKLLVPKEHRQLDDIRGIADNNSWDDACEELVCICGEHVLLHFDTRPS